MTANEGNTLTGNGAADLAPARADAGTVPDHAVLGSLVGHPHGVVLLVDLVKAPFLGCAKRAKRGKNVCAARAFSCRPRTDVANDAETMQENTGNKKNSPSGLLLHLMPATPWQVQTSVLPKYGRSHWSLMP